MVVLIPAYEPTEKMIGLISELKEKTDYRILVIDDGSGERYKEIFDRAEGYGCTVLYHSANRGKGAALKTGFAYLESKYEPDMVVCADSDGQHKVEDIIKLADAIEDGKQEMVLGVRQFTGNVPFKSRFGNSVSALMFKIATGIDLNDTQTGLRGYSYCMLPWLNSVEGQRFEYEQNLLMKSKKAGISIKQLPIATVYDDNNQGTHFRPFYDSISVLWPILKFGGSSILAFIVDFVFFSLFFYLVTGRNKICSNVMARLISATFNYIINKNYVFDAGNIPTRQSAIRYFSLAAVILTLNSGMIELLTMIPHMPVLLAKVLTEVTLYIISYTVQKIFVFKKDKDIRLTPF